MKYLLCLLSLLLMPGVAMAEDAPAGPPPANVVTAVAQEKMVAESTPIVGSLYFDRTSSLSAEVAGLVASVEVKAGDRVKKGDVLVRLNTDFTDQEIAQVQAQIGQLDVQIEQVAKDFKRYETLYKQEAASEKVFDDIVFSQRQLAKQREALGKQLQMAKLKKAKSSVKAPFDGLVLEKKVEVGDYVGPGVVFCRLGSLDDLCVKVPVAEDLVRFSKPGDEVEVTVNAVGETVQGRVVNFLPVADVMTKNVMLKIRLPRLEGIAENMSATARVAVSEAKNSLLAPRDAVVNFQGQTFVYTIKDGKAALLPVRIVSFVGEMAALESQALQAGMTVIVDGAARLRPDQPVKVVNGQ